MALLGVLPRKIWRGWLRRGRHSVFQMACRSVEGVTPRRGEVLMVYAFCLFISAARGHTVGPILTSNVSKHVFLEILHSFRGQNNDITISGVKIHKNRQKLARIGIFQPKYLQNSKTNQVEIWCSTGDHAVLIQKYKIRLQGSVAWVFEFWDPLISPERLKIQTSNFAQCLIVRDTTRKNDKLAKRGRGLDHVTYFSNFGTSLISPQWLKIQTSNFACGLKVRVLKQKMKNGLKVGVA